MKTDEDVLKGLPEPARELITKAQNEAKEALEQVNKLRAEAKATEDLTVAKGFVGETGIKAEDVALVLKQLDPAGVEVVKQVFAKANAIVKSGAAVLTAELGGTGGDATAVGKLDAAVAEIRKSNPALTVQQAVAKAYDNDPSLYAAMR
jgi:hypothetical protein